MIGFAASAHGHIEGNLFLEHPPKTNAGILVQTGSYEINGNASALTTFRFTEYMVHPQFSVGAGIPFGNYQDQSGASDAVLAVKSRFSAAGFTPVPAVTLELPTGDEPFSTGHANLVPALFMEKRSRICICQSYSGCTSYWRNIVWKKSVSTTYGEGTERYIGNFVLPDGSHGT